MTANLDRRASDRFGLLQRIADIGARRHREQTLLLCFRQFEAGKKIVDRFTADLVATRQALELFVWPRTALATNHRLDRFSEHFPSVVAIPDHLPRPGFAPS